MKDLKVGDIVITIEKYGDRIWKWSSTIIAIESNYIETCYKRDENNEELKTLVEKLSVLHRTYRPQYVRNYFAPDGSINIE